MPSKVAICRELSWDGDVPEWVQLLPLGPDVVGEDGRRWTLEDPDAFVERSKRNLPLPFDWEHATELKAPQGDPAPAAGWIADVAVFRDDAPFGPGVWAKVDWTPRGADSLRTREYRMQSPVFTHSADGRIHELVGAGLTNRPNLDLRALNRASEPEEKKTMNEEQRKALCSRLGLPTDTPEAAVAVALNARLDNQERELTTARGRITELETAANARELEDVKRDAETLISGAMTAGKVAPTSEAGFRALCSTRDGIAQAKAIIDTLPSIHAPTASGDVDATKKLAANAAAKPAGGTTVQRDANGKRILSAAEKAHCTKQGLNEDNYASILDEEDEG